MDAAQPALDNAANPVRDEYPGNENEHGSHELEPVGHEEIDYSVLNVHSIWSLSQKARFRELCRKLYRELNRNWAISIKFTTKFAIKTSRKAGLDKLFYAASFLANRSSRSSPFSMLAMLVA
jgi:hypothetical protein